MQMKTQFTRRHVLQAMSALGLSLSMPTMTARAANRRKEERPKSVITLWMGGGMSQLESWDPHPGTPSSDKLKAITTVDGPQISELLPQMAEHMHQTTLIRSLTYEEGDHERGSFFVRNCCWRLRCVLAPCFYAKGSRLG